MITKCCSAEVVHHFGKEFPDNSGFSISTSWPACNSCKTEWPETFAHRCCNCGEGADSVTETTLGSLCGVCLKEEAENLIERVES